MSYCVILLIVLVFYAWILGVLKGPLEGVLADGERLSCSTVMMSVYIHYEMNSGPSRMKRTFKRTTSVRVVDRRK